MQRQICPQSLVGYAYDVLDLLADWVTLVALLFWGKTFVDMAFSKSLRDF